MHAVARGARLLTALIFSACVYSIVDVPFAHAAQISRTVTTAADSGAGSLRQALLDANANITTSAAPHQITFNIPAAGVQTITLAATLPAITQPVSIDGTSQPGSSCGTLVPSITSTTNTPHTLMIAIDGSAVTMNTSSVGLIALTTAASGSRIHGLSIYGGIGTSGNIVYGSAASLRLDCNYIGLSPTGTVPASNPSYFASVTSATATAPLIENNVVAGSTRRTILLRISGTSSTVKLNGAIVRNNLIGTDPTGQSTRNSTTLSSTGILMSNADGALLENNVVSGNGNGTANSAGIDANTNVSNLTLRSSVIGANLGGTSAIPNTIGINYTGGVGQGWVVGGSSVADRNYIIGNRGRGFSTTTSAKAYGITFQNNYFGLAPNGTTIIPNTGHNLEINGFNGALVKDNVIVAAGSGTFGTVYGINASNSANNSVIVGNFVGITPSGVAAGNRTAGVNIAGSNNVRVGGVSLGDRNVISGNSTDANTQGIIVGSGSSGTLIRGNYVGVGVDGTTRVANGQGILIQTNTTTNTTVGGTAAAERNIISGNTSNGISLQTTAAASNISITGNYIGVDVNGNAIAGASATGTGINAASLNGTKIGGANPGEGNVISGNLSVGLLMTGANGGNGVTVEGNTIGLKPDGLTAAPNGTGIAGRNLTMPTGSYRIGGSAAGQGNTISGNTTDGINFENATATAAIPYFVRGNKIGVSSDGTVARPNGRGVYMLGATRYINIGGTAAGEANIIRNNTTYGVGVNGTTASSLTIRGNAISANGSLGIDLGTNGVTDNDAPSAIDADTGANNLQNFPRRTTMTKCDGSTETKTVLRSAANTTYHIDFYANPSGRDATGYGEGEQYISSTTVTTNASGYADVTPPSATNLSMTATDPNGSTSEFSNEREVSVSACAAAIETTANTSPLVSGAATLAGFSPQTTPTSVALTVNGNGYNASLSGNSWSLSGGTISPALADGSYDVAGTVTDPESLITTSFTTIDALTIDTVQPTLSITRKIGQAAVTNVDSAWFTLTISEPIYDDTNSIVSGIFSLGSTTGTVTTITKIDDTHFEIEVTGMSDGDTVTPSIAANELYDIAGNANTASTGDANSWVTYDITTPNGTIDALAPDIDNSPELTGTVSDPTATVTVTISGTDYIAINNGDGIWTLPAGTIQPGLAASDHAVLVTFADTAGNESTANTTITVIRSDADAPTVDEVIISEQPIAKGTFDSTNSMRFRVQLAGVWYELGVDPELSAQGDNWTLDLSVPLTPGTYSVITESTTRDGSIITNTASFTFVIPTASGGTSGGNSGILVETGENIFFTTSMALLSIVGGVLLYRRYRING